MRHDEAGVTQTEGVTLAVEGRVATVTIDRPETGNRITRAMMLALSDRLLAAADSADVLVIRASGEDFCLGRDQAERPAGTTPEDNLWLILQANAALDEFPGVSVTVVQGRAHGFGAGLVLHSDIAVAADTAVLRFDEIAHGFPPLIVMSYLADYVPHKHGLDLVLTGRAVPALEAREIGMVSRVVSAGQLDATVDALVASLSEADARALRRAKRFFGELDEVPAAERPRYGLEQLVRWRTEGA
jgi:enoyl-CoA hydratase/carnithine racemase